MATLAELQARLDALRALRARGIRRVSYQGQEVEFRSDAEMASAIADLERQVAALSGRRVSTVYINASKGV
ncbi:phage head-tail joining protein [Blastochloris tepida]|uniref:Uncharacterized protein n=1 Tax=Blastochloris tepida TaxID=2233851 RepID=A0A348G5T0_9HYPH|nr:hypothetical protein [Blastochloris tepida]BBF94913.1 hypothetical protein BLTE_35980 [Blastochloris tepida]